MLNLKSKLNPEKKKVVDFSETSSQTIPGTEEGLATPKYDSQGRKLAKDGTLRGMKTGAKSDPAPKEPEGFVPYSFLDKETLNAIVQYPFIELAKWRKNAKWILLPKESDGVVDALDKLIQKRLPSQLEKYGAEAELIFFIGSLVILKANQEDVIVKEPEPEESDSASQNKYMEN